LKTSNEVMRPEFEYIGHTGLTVIGLTTGIRYRFDHRGARLRVDARDAVAFQSVPLLRRVS
jgi:hypothetical protein